GTARAWPALRMVLVRGPSSSRFDGIVVEPGSFGRVNRDQTTADSLPVSPRVHPELLTRLPSHLLRVGGLVLLTSAEVNTGRSLQHSQARSNPKSRFNPQNRCIPLFYSGLQLQSADTTSNALGLLARSSGIPLSCAVMPGKRPIS